MDGRTDHRAAPLEVGSHPARSAPRALTEAVPISSSLQAQYSVLSLANSGTKQTKAAAEAIMRKQRDSRVHHPRKSIQYAGTAAEAWHGLLVHSAYQNGDDDRQYLDTCVRGRTRRSLIHALIAHWCTGEIRESLSQFARRVSQGGDGIGYRIRYRTVTRLTEESR